MSPSRPDAIVQEVVYPHPPERVWRALTDSAALAQWPMPNDFRAQLGHRFQFRATPQAGWGGVVSCEIVELEPLRRLAYTWTSDPGLPHTLVRFTLEPVTGGTRLRLEHSGFSAAGAYGLTIRDLLDQGWGRKLLRETLPALLDQFAQSTTAEKEDL